ncbi:holdfast anchoring protein HfaB [Caulobacter sp. B11]|uniref:holdfast anchoring protein HfaB n=1 Tax=Caulobacter sp. B11 TaxID=2048899 RepID=UPI001F283A78|nr:holdfast anchoring protein HfaB [Caulobacter sp. B11]
MATKHILLLLSAAACTALAGCGSTPKPMGNGNYATPIGTAPVTANPTPIPRPGLPGAICPAKPGRRAARRHRPHRGLYRQGRVRRSGRKVTQGASLLAMTAFAKAGMPMVERFDTSVSEYELKFANNKLISDNPNPGAGAPADYRKILAGQVPGSDFYVAGGITELNYNIRSAGVDAYAGDKDTDGLKGNFKRRVFVMNIALDLRLINTRTLEVVDVISYQKQVVGREVSLGVFDFLNGNLFDISGGRGALEPVQLAVRSLIERSVVEMSANLYGMPGPQSCLQFDPYGSDTIGATGAFVPAYDNLGTNNAQTREDPSRWSDRGDPALRPARRGRY